MTRQGAEQPPVYGITRARTRHSDDLEQRMVRYLVSMAIRTACVVLVLVIQHPVRWVFAVGAVLLPYIAVILANAAGPRRGNRDDAAPEPRELAAGTPEAAESERVEPVVLTGIVLPPDPAERSADGSGNAPVG